MKRLLLDQHRDKNLETIKPGDGGPSDENIFFTSATTKKEVFSHRPNKVIKLPIVEERITAEDRDPNIHRAKHPFEYLSLDTDKDISGLDEVQKQKLMDYYKEENNFVEKKTLIFESNSNTDIKDNARKSEALILTTPARKYNKVHHFFEVEYQRSTDKLKKVNRRLKPLSQDLTYLAQIRLKEDLNSKSKAKIIDVNNEHNIHGIKFSVPKLKFVKYYS
jgi:hypothetical protein